jgi:hypothetical protein
MTRITITKLAATALAVASLGIAGTAQAAPVDPAQPVQAAQQNQTVQGTAAQQQGPGFAQGEPAPGTKPGQVTPPAQTDDEIDYTSDQYFKSDEARKRFERYCNLKDAEPSHSDKKFCEDYRKHNGGLTSDSTSSTGKPYPKPYPGRWQEHTHYEDTPVYVKDRYVHRYVPHVETTSSNDTLPFTGLEVWQLALLGVALVGGGLAARRLLVR